MPRIVQTLCEDLLLGTDASGSLLANVDDDALASLMAEVTDPGLRGSVLRLAVAVANADRHLAEGELCVCLRRRAAIGLALKLQLQPRATESQLLGRPPERTHQVRAAASSCITKGWCCPRRDRMA
jgi:hypothetical protein